MESMRSARNSVGATGMDRHKEEEERVEDDIAKRFQAGDGLVWIEEVPFLLGTPFSIIPAPPPRACCQQFPPVPFHPIFNARDSPTLTTSLILYVFGMTSLAFAVGTSKSGMQTIALTSFAQSNLSQCPMPNGGDGGFIPHSSCSAPGGSSGRTSERGI